MFVDFEAFGLNEEIARSTLDIGDDTMVWSELAPPSLVPTVFLPGLLCDAALWRPQIESLSDRIAPVVGDLTLDDSVQAMARRVLAAAPQRFSLVALSMGGYVALEILRQAPWRVTRLALLDTSARPDTPERAAEREAGIASLANGRFLGVTHALLRTLVHPDKLSGPVAETLRTMALRVGRDAFLRQQKAILARPDSRDDLRHIDIPTLVAVGADDRVTPLADAIELAALIPGAELHIFDRCGHMPAVELPDQTTQLLCQWLIR